MRREGRPSWEIRLDQPQVLALALYVRDVAGIVQEAAPRDLPEAQPRVAPAGAGAGPPELTTQWNAWWARALTSGREALRDLEPPHFPAFDEAPALQAVLRVQFHAARRWSGDVRNDTPGAPPLGGLVAAVEHRLGRAAAPFVLRLDEVPVAGQGLWRVADGHLLLSAALVRDHERLSAALRPEVERLA